MSSHLDVDAYYDQRLPATVAVSPDGTRIAFTVRERDPDEETDLTSLFVVPADGSREPHRLTRLPGASSPAWGPNGDRLAFLTTRDDDVALRAGRDLDDESEDDVDEDGETDADTDEDGETDTADGPDETPQVWLFDLSLGGDARQVTDFEYGVSAFEFAPDGDRLAVTSRVPTDEEREYLAERRDGGPIETERLQHKAEGQGYLHGVETGLFVQSLAADAEPTRLDAVTFAGVTTDVGGPSFAWGPSGIDYVSNDGDRPQDSYATDIFRVEPTADATPERLTAGDGTFTRGGLAHGPDGELAYLRSPAANAHATGEVCRYDGAERSLTPALDRPISGVAWAGDRPLARVGDEGTSRLLAVGDETAELDGWSDETTGVGGFDASGETVAAVRFGPNAREVAASVSGETPTRLTDLTPDDGLSLTVDRFSLDSADGPVESLVYDADGDTDTGDDPRPLIVDIHGGPVAYDEPRYGFIYRYWVSRGYLVANVNYRGSSSYGQSFSEAIRGEWGPREAEDVIDSIAHLTATGRVDGDRIFVTGFSQGGVNTPHVLARTDRVTAAAAQHGLYDMYSAFGTDDSHVWWENDFGLPWEETDSYHEASTLPLVGDIDTPTLVTAGGNDHRCPPPQADQLHVALRKRDVPSKLIRYPETNHAYGSPETAIHRLEAVTEWFERFDPDHERGDDSTASDPQ